MLARRIDTKQRLEDSSVSSYRPTNASGYEPRSHFSTSDTSAEPASTVSYHPSTSDPLIQSQVHPSAQSHVPNFPFNTPLGVRNSARLALTIVLPRIFQICLSLLNRVICVRATIVVVLILEIFHGTLDRRLRLSIKPHKVVVVAAAGNKLAVINMNRRRAQARTTSSCSHTPATTRPSRRRPGRVRRQAPRAT